MTGRSAITWIIISLLSAVFLGLSIAAFAVGRGDWLAFFQSPARVGVILVSLILGVASLFSGSGGMNPGKKEDRRNRWVLVPLTAITLGMLVLPPYLDGRNLWTTDEAVTPYVGLALFASAAYFALRRCLFSAAVLQALSPSRKGTALLPTAFTVASAIPATPACWFRVRDSCLFFAVGSAYYWSPPCWPSCSRG